MVRERSLPALLSKHAPEHSAFTSHGCPRVCVHTASSAAAVNPWPVSSVCCPASARVSASVKSPRRSDFAATLKGLPPAMTSPELAGQHTEETGQGFTAAALETVWTQTRGQPWLVNALCAGACFDNKAGRDRSRTIGVDDVYAAREDLILSRRTHLDQLAHKLEEERVRRVIEPILSGGEARHEARDLEYLRDLGLIDGSEPPRVANPIYAEVVPRELGYILQSSLDQQAAWYVDGAGGLDMAKLLTACWKYSCSMLRHAM